MYSLGNIEFDAIPLLAYPLQSAKTIFTSMMPSSGYIPLFSVRLT
jgi:hypothetical protein